MQLDMGMECAVGFNSYLDQYCAVCSANMDMGFEILWESR